MTIEQTVEIPASRRLAIDVPPEVPEGITRVIIQFPVPDAPKPAKGGAASATPHTDFLSGILAGLGDISLEQIREERLSKYLL